MKWILLTAGGGILTLFALSVVFPLVPVWVGGVVGIMVFLVWGNLVARIIG